MNRLLPATAVACLLISACTGGPNRVPVGQDLITTGGGNVISAGGGNLIGGAGGNLASGGVSASSGKSSQPESAAAMPTTVRLAMPSSLDPAQASTLRLLAEPGPDLATSLRDNLAFYHEPSRRIDALLAAAAKAKPGATTVVADPVDADAELTVVREDGRLAIHDGETQLLGLTFTSAKAGKAVLRLENAGRRYFATDFDLAAGNVSASIALETPSQTLAGNWAFTAKAEAFTFEAATFVHRPAEPARDGLVVISGAVLDGGLGAYTYGGKTASSGDRFLYLSRDGRWVAASEGADTQFYLDATGEDMGESYTTPAQREALETRVPSATFPESPLMSDPFESDRFAFPN